MQKVRLSNSVCEGEKTVTCLRFAERTVTSMCACAGTGLAGRWIAPIARVEETI